MVIGLRGNTTAIIKMAIMPLTTIGVALVLTTKTPENLCALGHVFCPMILLLLTILAYAVLVITSAFLSCESRRTMKNKLTTKVHHIKRLSASGHLA